MTLPTLSDIDFRGKRVLLRADLNVPLDPMGAVSDDTRIRAIIPTMKKLLEGGASIVLLSHMGRPKGVDPLLSLKPCAKRLEELLGTPVGFAEEVRGESVNMRAKALRPGEILLLENLRFCPGEKKPDSDPEFAKELAQLGDLYVNDAFSAAHRDHTSTARLAKLFPGRRAVGLHMGREVAFFEELMESPERPFFAIVGGAKISSKIGVLKALLKKVDALFVVGAMANSFLLAKGIEMGDSLLEKESLSEAKAILEEAEAGKIPIYLPIDVVLENEEVLKPPLSNGQKAMDIGPQTVQLFSEKLKEARTVFWNGPAGVFETAPFERGTEALAKSLSHLDAEVVVGGGDSAAALQRLGLAGSISHLSTGGGASLELLEKGQLPGIEALKN